MTEPMMDEAALRDMLERATAVEPPIGPVVSNAVRAAQRRRRRRVAGAAALLAVAAAVGLTVPAVTGPDPLLLRSLAQPRHRLCRECPGPAVGTPISTTTNQAGAPIGLGAPTPRWPRRHPNGKSFTFHAP